MTAIAYTQHGQRQRTMPQITPSPLATLATQINYEHQQCVEAFKATLGHAHAAGELLIAAKAQVRHGEWLPWLKENCPAISDRTARNYMRIYREWDSLPSGIEGIKEALAALAPAKSETVANLPRHDWENPEHFIKCCSYWADYWRTNVYLMASLGMSMPEIAKRTGKTLDQCLRAMSPEFPNRWIRRTMDHFSIYHCCSHPDELIPYYTQCLKHRAYSIIAGDYQRAAIAAERYQHLSAVAVLTMQAQVAAAKANSVAPPEPFWQVAAESNDDWVWALWTMLEADAAWAVGTVEQSEVDKVGGYDAVFYVLEAMDHIKSARAA